MFDTILGIDPGLTRCGWGVIETGGPALRAIGWGVLRTPRDAPVAQRLEALAVGLRDVVSTHRPRRAAVEQVLFNANVHTAMSVGQAAGVALLVCAEAGIDVGSYSPTQVKAAVAGFGRADKAQMRSAVRLLLRLSTEPPADAADALGLALCHSTAEPLHAAIDRAGGKPRANPKLTAAIAAALDAQGGSGGEAARGGRAQTRAAAVPPIRQDGRR